MLNITDIKIENVAARCVTDNHTPVLRFALESDKADTVMTRATVQVGEWTKSVSEQTGILLDGIKMQPFSEYTVHIKAENNHGDIAEGSICFMTGRLDTEWQAKWISDNTYKFEDKTSPMPLTFRRKISVGKRVKKAYITATALGIYELTLNGQKVGNEYFAPGFTSYKNILQYNYYDVTEQIKGDNEIIAVVGGGWAVGRFTWASRSKITCDRQALRMEIFIEYEDGSKDRIITDDKWEVTREGNYRFGDFYDGETYDATVDLDKVVWRQADIYKAKINPKIVARYGNTVTAQEILKPIESYISRDNREYIYDFGQNFAGVVRLKIKGKKGQKIVVRHAEILLDGELCVKSLRTAKATATYICTDGVQEYSPRLTYMGFRYVGISGIDSSDIEVSAIVLHSDFDEIGSFECSDARLNRLQSNIRWSGKSNFVDIPTDCPQRDERQGWTGDISVFARTACYNFDISRFLNKWLLDVKCEQGRGGGIPMVVPKQGDMAPTVATACWGDSCILVPWAEYLARGDREVLVRYYPVMQKFLHAVSFWTALYGVGKYNRHIWKWLFQFGDWCAPQGNRRDWMKRGKWIATAYYANSCKIVSKIARIIGKNDDADYYAQLSEKIADAYRHKFTDCNGLLYNEFQTGYVLPLYFDMVQGDERANMAINLDRLVRENDYHLSTGFTGTPFLLFALADNGYLETAYKVLLQDTPPSWLYCIEKGATTTWEEWDIDPRREGNIPSYNHYAYGAVGDFLYRRVLGVEATVGGYKRFRVSPLLGGGLTFARGSFMTPYGQIAVSWKISDGQFTIDVTVPVSTACELALPDGQNIRLGSGKYSYTVDMP